MDVKYNHYKRKSRQKAARVCALSRKGIQNKCQNHHHQENPHISEKPNGDKTDHRIAMAFSIAGLAADGETQIIDSQCVDVSYPEFYATLNLIGI